jgi:hypothetical protein
MKMTCGCRFLRWILACLLSVSFAPPANTGAYLEKHDSLVTSQGASAVLGTIYTSADPVSCRIKRTNRVFSPDHSQPEVLSSTLDRFNRHLIPFWLLGESATNPIAGSHAPHLNDRAPPLL